MRDVCLHLNMVDGGTRLTHLFEGRPWLDFCTESVYESLNIRCALSLLVRSVVCRSPDRFLDVETHIRHRRLRMQVHLNNAHRKP